MKGVAREVLKEKEDYRAINEAIPIVLGLVDRVSVF